MNAIFSSDMDVIDYIPGSDTESGVFVVIGSIVGITKSPIKAGQLGTITTRGVFKNVAKHNSANPLTVGQLVYVNPANGKIYNSYAAGFLPCGYALKAAAATDTTCKLLLVPIQCQNSHHIPHTPSAKVTAGSLVVSGSLVGYAENTIEANAPGLLATSGVFTVSKYNVSNALTAGQLVYVNPSNGKIYNASAQGYILCGYAAEEASATATSCTIYLTPSCTAAAAA
ncbi:MAG: DUF2190 family protein [Thermoguttaceae bacterium]|nr:DUF2190 family protein [Thermoguttaceae bacterium]